MKRISLLFALCVLSQHLYAQIAGSTVVGSTVSALPSASTRANYFYFVFDGTTTSDCSVGGGSSSVICHSNGSSWSPASSACSGTANVAYSAAPTLDTTKCGLVVTLTGNMAPTIPAGGDGQYLGMDFEPSGSCATTACVITWLSNWIGTFQPGSVAHQYVEARYFAIDGNWRQTSPGVATAAASSTVTQGFLTGAGAYTFDSGFTGIAFDVPYSVGASTGVFLNSSGQALLDLLAPSGHGWLRMGGNGASQQSYVSGQARGSSYIVGDAGLLAFANAVEPTGWNVIWTLNPSLSCSNTNVSTQCLNGSLGSPTISTVAADISAYTTQIATEVAKALKLTQDWIGAGGTQGQLYFEAGNEPGAWVNNSIRWQPAEGKNTGCGLTLFLGVTSGALNGTYNFNNQITGNGSCSGSQPLTFSSAAGGFVRHRFRNLYF